MLDSEQIDELLADIKGSPELTLFFKRLFEDETYWKLFFLYRDEIFPVNEGNFLKYIFWNNITDESIRAFKILTNNAELKSIVSKSSQEDMKSTLFPQEIVSLIQDPIIYSLIKFIRSNPDIMELVNQESFDYITMKQKLQDYSKINSNIVEEIGNAVSGKQIDDSDFVKMLSPLISGFQNNIKNYASDFGHYLPNMNDTLPGAFLTIHAGYGPHMEQLLELTNLTKVQYTELISELHSQKNLINLNTIFWCKNCVDENIILSSESSLNPHHQKISCPRCSTQMLVSTVFELDEIIEMGIMDKDGMLQLATSWFLSTNEVDFETNSSDGQFEYDFICKIPSHNMLLECKMHRQKHDERQLRIWVEEDFKQAHEHYNQIKDTHKIEMCWIISNIDTTKNMNLINEIRKKYPEQIGYANIGSLPQIIQQVKPS